MSKKNSCQKRQRSHKVSSGARQRRKEANRRKQEAKAAERLHLLEEEAKTNPAAAVRLERRRNGNVTWTRDKIDRKIIVPAEMKWHEKTSHSLDLISDQPARRKKARPEQIGSLFEPVGLKG